MKKQIKYKSPIVKIITNSLIDLPSPSNISLMWNLGSMLGACLMMQILTGMLLSFHYCPNTSMAFNSIIHISRDMNYGWLIRISHANGASIFFLLLYIHVARGLYYSSFILKETWMVGVLIMFLSMATAFMGYVLPWGQMSFWGATVITNLLSAIPYLGIEIVQWIWGGFAVENPTLNRFFSFHFILPFIIISMVMIHLMFLHQTGSNNPMGTNSNLDKIPFHPYFSLKDSLSLILMILTLMMINLIMPFMLSDPDNFIPANPLVTPIHIKPEWYFLFAYAILRSIPNKLGGVIALIMSIMILMLIPLMSKKSMNSNQFYPLNKIMFWMFITIVILLTWIGARPVETPYIMIGQLLTNLYFMFFIMNQMIYKLWDLILKY